MQHILSVTIKIKDKHYVGIYQAKRHIKKICLNCDTSKIISTYKFSGISIFRRFGVSAKRDQNIIKTIFVFTISYLVVDNAWGIFTHGPKFVLQD